jgi:uncharacterized protein YceK
MNLRAVAVYAVLASCVASGCGTLCDRGAGPCPKARESRIYGGVRTDLAAIAENPTSPWNALVVLDLPISAVADTLSLPGQLSSTRKKTGKPSRSVTTEDLSESQSDESESP